MTVETIVIVSLLLAILVRMFWRVIRELLVITSVACVFIGVITLVIGISTYGGGLSN